MGILNMKQATTEGLKIVGELTEQAKEILTPEALEFIVSLHGKFNEQRKELLEKRKDRQKDLMLGINSISYKKQSIFVQEIGQ